MRYTIAKRTAIVALLTGVAGTVLWHTGAVPLGAYIGPPLLAVAALLALIGSRPPYCQPVTPEPEDCQQPRPVAPADPDNPDSLVDQMLGQGRYALLLRPQVACDLRAELFERTLTELQNHMALVPDGAVVLGDTDGNAGELEIGADGSPRQPRSVRVAPYFLDRYPVTNREFFEFVASGGYEQIAFWDTAIWPAVLDFVDRSGRPGPCFWNDGCYAVGRHDHPVVGVCWYEAAAYARWAGKRLPTDAEWVKSGAWPVMLSNSQSSQRRFPWGDTMDRSKANLWGSGPGHTVSVRQYDDGVSVGGIYQLIGNVWEWTRSDYVPSYFAPEEFIAESPLKSLRGGAFDTYFDNQATCQFQSGDIQIARKQNIGFRCAVSVCDLMLYQESTRDDQDSDLPEEVLA